MIRLPSILSYGLYSIILRRKIPLLASFKVTYRCNLRCTGCPYHRRARGPGAHMHREQAVNSLNELKGLGCCGPNKTSGESPSSSSTPTTRGSSVWHYTRVRRTPAGGYFYRSERCRSGSTRRCSLSRFSLNIDIPWWNHYPFSAIAVVVELVDTLA